MRGFSTDYRQPWSWLRLASVALFFVAFSAFFWSAISWGLLSLVMLLCVLLLVVVGYYGGHDSRHPPSRGV